jgi:hypothetical protein
MTIEIQTPELEALIQQWMMSGSFQNVEEVLMQALKSAPLPAPKIVGQSAEMFPVMGAELVAAMQASPFKDICLESGSESSPVREIGF